MDQRHVQVKLLADEQLEFWPEMPEDYTCGCGLYVHPKRINPAAYHINDCPWSWEMV